MGAPSNISHLREHVGFAEFTGRDVRMPVSLRPRDRILLPFSSWETTIGVATQVLLEVPADLVISVRDCNLGKAVVS